MVKVKTVLVLGAGASCGWKFPTGGQLVEQICDTFRSPLNPQSQLLNTLCPQPQRVRRFAAILHKADPPSIDAWLEKNQEFIDIGKTAIAITMLQYEHNSRRPQKNWYQLLWWALDCQFDQFHKNKLAIVTFNYDRSLEQYLFTAFKHTHTKETNAGCIEEFNKLRILHVYGSLGRLEWQPQPSDQPQVRYGAEFNADVVQSAASSIKIIPEGETLPKEFKDAHKLIKEARAIYFLGFGFYPANIERLGGKDCFLEKKVMGTAWGMGRNDRLYVDSISEHKLNVNRKNLQNMKVYEFVDKCISFNEPTLPPDLPEPNYYKTTENTE